MISATAKLLDRQKVNELPVSVTIVATIAELREFSTKIEEMRAKADMSIIPWPVGQLSTVFKKVVDATVDRVESTAEVLT